MKIGRRLFAFGSVAAALVGVRALGFADAGIVRRTLDVIEEVYGKDIARHPEAVKFAQAYQAFVRAKGVEGIGLDISYKFHMEKLPYTGSVDAKIRESVINKFATSTNVVIADETGVPLEFSLIFHPYDASCTSQLGPQNMV